MSRPFSAALRAAFLLSVSLSAADSARADEIAASSDLPPVVVSATRLPTPADEVASSVTIITHEQIEQHQWRTLPDALRSVPGLSLVQTGGPGGLTSVFARGANSNHTKVLIDGIDVSDPSSPNDAFDFSQIQATDIERIEVLRGPQSGLYGSDAIGGVVSITTRKGSGPAAITGSLEGGSFGTFNQTAGASGGLDRFHYAFDVGHQRSDATPVTPPELVPPGVPIHDDVYDNTTFSMRLGADLTPTLDVGLTTRYADGFLKSTGDDFSTFPSHPAAQQSDSETRELFTRGIVHALSFDGKLDQTLGVGFTDYRRRALAPGSDPEYDRGDRIKLDWQGNVTVAPGEILTLGAEHQRDEIGDSPISAGTNIDSGYAQLQSSIGDRFFNSVSLRFDDNDRFGGKTTYRIAPSYLLKETDTRLKGSVGTGFKAPSLNQLFVSFPAFNFFANPNLKPESSFGWDAGFEQTVPGYPVKVGATYFDDKFDNLIVTNATGTSYANVARASAHGIESFIRYDPTDRLSFRFDHTYTIAQDDMNHFELLRRPRNKFSLDADWRTTDKLTLTGGLILVGPHTDGNRDFSIPRLHASGYTIVNLAASYAVTEKWSVFGRIDNALDEHYQDPVGFLRPGIGVFAGISTKL